MVVWCNVVCNPRFKVLVMLHEVHDVRYTSRCKTRVVNLTFHQKFRSVATTDIQFTGERERERESK